MAACCVFARRKFSWLFRLCLSVTATEISASKQARIARQSIHDGDYLRRRRLPKTVWFSVMIMEMGSFSQHLTERQFGDHR
jgi:hypothetical protein